MEHLSTKKPQCLLYASAMVLGTSVDKIIEHIGHDGLDVVDPSLAEPQCYRGIHVQEICDFAWKNGQHLQLIQAMPFSACKGSNVTTMIYPPEVAGERLEKALMGQEAIITGLTNNGNEHAVAFNGTNILDPMGTSYPLDQFRIREAWILI